MKITASAISSLLLSSWTASIVLAPSASAFLDENFPANVVDFGGDVVEEVVASSVLLSQQAIDELLLPAAIQLTDDAFTFLDTTVAAFVYKWLEDVVDSVVEPISGLIFTAVTIDAPLLDQYAMSSTDLQFMDQWDSIVTTPGSNDNDAAPSIIILDNVVDDAKMQVLLDEIGNSVRDLVSIKVQLADDALALVQEFINTLAVQFLTVASTFLLGSSVVQSMTITSANADEDPVNVIVLDTENLLLARWLSLAWEGFFFFDSCVSGWKELGNDLIGSYLYCGQVMVNLALALLTDSLSADWDMDAVLLSTAVVNDLSFEWGLIVFPIAQEVVGTAISIGRVPLLALAQSIGIPFIPPEAIDSILQELEMILVGLLELIVNPPEEEQDGAGMARGGGATTRASTPSSVRQSLRGRDVGGAATAAHFFAVQQDQDATTTPIQAMEIAIDHLLPESLATVAKHGVDGRPGGRSRRYRSRRG